MENKKLELEAEMGRLFFQIEQAKQAQVSMTNRINEILSSIRAIEEEAKRPALKEVKK
jgi:hypothetical protein